MSNELSVNEISLANHNSLHLITDDRLAGHIPDTIMEEEQHNENQRIDSNSASSSTSSRDSLKTTILPQNGSRHNSLLPEFNNTSTCNSNASSPARSVKSFHTSVPNLRMANQTITSTPNGNANGKLPLHPTPPKKRVGRSCSQGDVQLRKNFGSTDLLSRAFLGGSSTTANSSNNKRNSIADIPRHGSVENVLNVEKRKQKTPTIVNRIHNLEVCILLYFCYYNLVDIKNHSLLWLFSSTRFQPF